MHKLLFLFPLIFFLNACYEEKPHKNLDAKKLTQQKCASCHNLDMPPYISEKELAPPLMSISFHVYDFVKPSNESQREATAIAFIEDYVRYPSREKSFCDPKSLEIYGLMPSQKDKLTTDEAHAIATHMVTHYTPKNLSKIQKEKALYDKLPEGKKVALKFKCLGCHKVDKKTVGPSLIDIAQKYIDANENMIHAIQKGSSGKWANSNGAVMPAFKQINDTDIKALASWIQKLSK